jgi:excisionase family DNA binding protein
LHFALLDQELDNIPPFRSADRPDLPQCVDLAGGVVLEMRVRDSQYFVPGGDGPTRMMADKYDILLNSREVAFLLDLSPDTVNEFARRNILPAFKKGRQWRFRKRDIASFKRHMRGVNAAA